MKGIVFTELIEFMEETHGPVAVSTVLEGAQLKNGGSYTSVGTYPPEEAVAILGSASQYTGVPVPEILKSFGKHLFGRFHAHYPQFFKTVDHGFDFLERVETYVHPEVLKLYPDAQLPRFESRRVDAHTMVMTYRSERAMGDLAEGLVEACLTHFGHRFTIERVSKNQERSVEQFYLKVHE